MESVSDSQQPSLSDRVKHLLCFEPKYLKVQPTTFLSDFSKDFMMMVSTMDILSQTEDISRHEWSVDTLEMK